MKRIILTIGDDERRERLRLAKIFFKKAIAGEVKSYSEIPQTHNSKKDKS